MYFSLPFVINTVSFHRSICKLTSSSSLICALFGIYFILGTTATFLHGKFPFNTNNFLNRFYSIKSWVLFIPVRLMTRMEPILKQAVWCLCHHVHRNTQRLSHRRTNEQLVTQRSGINISYISQHGESLPAACQEITSRQCTKTTQYSNCPQHACQGDRGINYALKIVQGMRHTERTLTIFIL